MKSLIMVTLLTISSTVQATEAMQRYPIMDQAAGLARVILEQCKDNGSIIIAIMVNGKLEKYLVDCHVTRLGG